MNSRGQVRTRTDSIDATPIPIPPPSQSFPPHSTNKHHITNAHPTWNIVSAWAPRYCFRYHGTAPAQAWWAAPAPVAAVAAAGGGGVRWVAGRQSINPVSQVSPFTHTYTTDTHTMYTPSRAAAAAADAENGAAAVAALAAASSRTVDGRIS